MAEMKKTPGRLSSIRNTVKKLTERLSDDHSAEGTMKDEQEREKEKLLVQLRSLEEEVRRLHQARHQLEQANRQNERLTDALQDTKAQIEAMRDEQERSADLPAPLLSQRLGLGDHILYDARSGYLHEKPPKDGVDDLLQEEVPIFNYIDTGGLHHQIEQIHDHFNLPYLHSDIF